MTNSKLLKEINKWSNIYQFSFQFWGEGNNNVFIEKNDVELTSFGGEKTPEDIMKKTLEWVLTHNPGGYKPVKINNTWILVRVTR